MTKEEFMEKYGDVEVTFSYYYKYVFHYTGTLEDGSSIEVEYGGNPDDIYRFEACVGDVETVRGLEPFSGGVYKDYQEIEGFYDY